MTGPVVKALGLVAGVLFMLTLIGVSMTIFSPATDASKEANSDLSATTSELKDQKYIVYENNTLSGSQVVNALRRFKIDGEAGNIVVKVTTGTNGGKSYYGTFSGNKILIDKTATPDKVNDSTSAEYVNPSGMFKATLVRDKNSVIRVINFTQDTVVSN